MENKKLPPVSLGVYRQLIFDLAMKMSDNGSKDIPYLDQLITLADRPVKGSIRIDYAGGYAVEAKQNADSISIVTYRNDGYAEVANIRYRKNGFASVEIINGNTVLDLNDIPMGTVPAAVINDITTNNAGERPLRFWKDYHYYANHYTLMFVPLSLTDKQVVDLLHWFDVAYGNTDQDTARYALEYQLLARMLVSEHDLLVNPFFLDMDKDYLNETGFWNIIGTKNSEKYCKYLDMKQEQINQMSLDAD